MTRIPTAPIPLPILQEIVKEFDIMEKIQDGRLTSEEVSRRQASDPALPNAFARILKHYSTGVNRRQIATSHQAIGTPEPHWHVTDLIFQGVRFIRPPNSPDK